MALIAAIIIGSTVLNKLKTFTVSERAYKTDSSSLSFTKAVIDDEAMKNILRCTKCTSLYFTGCTFTTDADALSSMTQLRTFDAENCDGIESFAFINSLTDLYTLRIADSGLSDATFSLVNEMPSLSTLMLAKGELTNADFLSLMPKLCDIDLSDNSIKSVDAVSDYTNLISVNLGGNKITALSKEFNSLALSKLYLKDNPLTDISGLGSLTRLKEFSCTASSLPEGSLDFISKSKETLTYIDISDSALDHETLKGIFAGLDNLTMIRMDGNAVNGSLDFISSKAPLKELCASNCGITDLIGISSDKMTVLDLDDNEIFSFTSIPKLSTETSVKLFLNNNKITSLSGIDTRSSYNCLLLNGNPITDVPSVINENLKGSRFSIDYNEKLDMSVRTGFATRYVAGIPKDKQLDWKDKGYIKYGYASKDGEEYIE